MSATRKSIFAALPATTRGSPVHMGNDPKGKTFLYTNGRSVIIRDIENPGVADQYFEHTHNATVARYAPSGYYIASGDASGKVRIWDTVQAEHPLKNEVNVISGEIRDLAWDSESKRIIAVGNGQELFGRAFLMDSGSSVGEITGHSKVINSVDIKPTRPYRAVTVSDDLSVNFYEGPPFKYKASNKDHQRFINCVRFNSTGTHFVTVGSDSKIFLFNGANGEKVGEIGGPAAHAGSIFSCAWSSDGNHLLTCSGDRTVKLWDVGTQSNVSTFTFGTAVDDQQVGCLWQGSHLLSLSLSGEINYLDRNETSKPSRVIRGHNKPTMSLVYKDATLFTGDTAGRICSWDQAGNASPLAGPGHSNQATSLSIQDDNLVSAGMDDTIRWTPLATKTTSADAYKVDSQPKAVAGGKGGVAVAVAVKSIVLLKDGKQAEVLATPYQGYSVAISPCGTEVAVGADEFIQTYTISGSSLTEKSKIAEQARGQISALSYSPDGNLLASGDSQRQVTIFERSTGKVKISDFVFHQARITSLSWTPSSQRIASGSIDTHIYVWSIATPGKRIQIKNAHVGQVNGVAFFDEDTLTSVGQDACLKTWSIKHH